MGVELAKVQKCNNKENLHITTPVCIGSLLAENYYKTGFLFHLHEFIL